LKSGAVESMATAALGGYHRPMTDTIFPLSGDTFCIKADFNGVTLELRCGPHLFPAVLSDELIDLWIERVQIELAAVAPEMKTALRKVNQTPLFGAPDA
jgi:hypothetical protein